MPTQLENIANSLQAAGAGIQGRLPEFQQQQRQALEQQQAQEEAQRERLETAYKDAQGALNLARQGRWEDVIRLGANRLQLLQSHPDADPSDTQRLTQLAIAARNGSNEAQDNLVNELESQVKVGQAMGVLEQPSYSSSDLVEVQDPEGGTRYATATEAAREGLGPPREDAQGTETEREINRLTERLRGQVENPEQVAQDIARGYVEIEQLESGQVRLLDRVAAAAGRGDEAITELPVNPLTEETEEIRPYNTVYDLADQIAGAVPFAKNVWGRLAGQTGANIPESEAEARSFVDTTQQSLISSLRENERFSEAEADRISEMTDLSPSVLDSPDSFRARSRGVADYLRTRQALEERAADNSSLPSGTRESAASAANSIEEYLTFLGAPERLSTDDFQSTESINMYPPESIVRYAEDATAEELDQLPEESRQRILEIVRGQSGNR